MRTTIHTLTHALRCCIVVTLLTVCSHAQSAEPTHKVLSQDIAPSFRMSEETVTLPFKLIHGFPFVEAEIGGVKGKLLLDTGAEDALALNDHKVPLTGGKQAGNGAVGSGQRFAITLRADVGEVKLVGYKNFSHVTTVRSSNADFLERVTPDFLGWLGYNFWLGYAMKIDYDAKVATFYKNDASDAVQPRYLAGETLIGNIPFEIRKLPNQPIMQLKIGSRDFLGAFDTGTNGTLYIEDKTRVVMRKERTLVAVGTEDGDEFFDIDRVGIFKDRNYQLRRIEVQPAPFPAAVQLGLNSPDIITLGYSFLKNFKTVWDFQRKQIYLLAPAPQ